MKFVRLAIALLTLVTLATAQDTLSGKWKITWLQGGKPNIVNLTEDIKGHISGTYINDAKESCPVAGNTDKDIILVVICPSWSIAMAGHYDHAMGEPSDEVVGKYLAFGTTSGTFRMDRQICMLPEGCTGDTK